MEVKMLIVSTGPGNPSLMTLETADLLRSSPRIILRTDHHPVAGWLREQNIAYTSLDSLYETSEDFEELYDGMARALWSEAEKHQNGQPPLLYAVPDPMTDRSADRLFALFPEASDCVRVLPGVSASDAFLAAARSYLRGSGVRILPAASLSQGDFDPSVPFLITELDSAAQTGDVKICLSDLLDDDAAAVFLQGSDQGCPSCKRIPLYELDRQPFYNHLSAVFLPGADREHRTRFTLRDLEAIMEILRAPDGCPWDSTQTHSTLKPYLVEEAWEAVNAIDAQDMDHLADELGDVLLQIVFHASIGRAFDEFTLTDVISNICRKMISRHPHVFGSERMSSAAQVSDAWETIKRQETGSRSVADSLEDVSEGLPSLKYAVKVQKKAMQLEGFRRAPAEIQQDILALSGRVLEAGAFSEENMGELLMRCAELCHRCGPDAEILLHEAVNRYKAAIHRMYETAEKQGKNPESLTFRDECVYLGHVKDRN